MNPEVLALIAEQARREYYASSFYLAASHWCNRESYTGSQRFFELASLEERDHLQRFLLYLNEYADQPVTIPAVERKGTWEFQSLSDTFTQALTLELEVTEHIKEIARQADAKGDQETEAFLQWFLLEQIQSVSELRTLGRLLTHAGEDPAALLQVDDRIGALAQA